MNGQSLISAGGLVGSDYTFGRLTCKHDKKLLSDALEYCRKATN